MTDRYFKTLTIGALTGFAQAPHPDARMVIGSFEADPKIDGIVHAGWLMPQVQEVDDKTARFTRERERREARAVAHRIHESWLRSKT